MRTYNTKKTKYKRIINGNEFHDKKWIRIANNGDEKKFWREINSSDELISRSG